MKRYAILALCFVLMLSLLAGCTVIKKGPDTEAFSEILGVDLTDTTASDYFDSHGGFHGDGILFIKYHFFDETGKAEVAKSEKWRDLPLSETGEEIVGGFLNDRESEPLIPQIENGRWFFEDRHPERNNPADDSEVLNRNSVNFTFAIFDYDTNTLYFAMMDT